MLNLNVSANREDGKTKPDCKGLGGCHETQAHVLLLPCWGVAGGSLFPPHPPNVEVLSKQDLAAAGCPAACNGLGALPRLQSRFPEQHLALWTLISD